jgi:hypothetical protein
MSSWKLVEAETEPAAPAGGQLQQGVGGMQQQGGRGQGRGAGGRGYNPNYQGRGQGRGAYQGRGGRGGRGGYRNYNNYNNYVMTPQDCVYFAFMAVQQM